MSSIDTGVSVASWGGRRAQEALQSVKANGRRRRTPCCICHQPIDYSLPSTEADGCTVQHIMSRRDYPHLTWFPSNWKPAHRSCNTSEGAGDNSAGEIVTSEEW